jgi:hypothetical protein
MEMKPSFSPRQLLEPRKRSPGSLLDPLDPIGPLDSAGASAPNEGLGKLLEPPTEPTPSYTKTAYTKTVEKQISVPAYDPRPGMGGWGGSAFQALLPGLIGLVGRIRQDLETNRTKLLSLNPGRRDAIVQYLELLAGTIPKYETKPQQPMSNPLQKWLDELRSPNQSAALKVFFEEVAIIAIGQVLLLKTWADRGLNPFKKEDLGKLNWALNSALKPLLPMDREGWQLTRQNLYSWYNPSLEIQKDIWNTLEPWKLDTDDFSIIPALVRLARQARPSAHATGNLPQLYDPRFFSSLWSHLSSFGFDPKPETTHLQRRKIAFTPTLRDGSPLESAPKSLSWIGLENHCFQLFIAELMQLWNGISAPPLWAQGNGLEVHSRDQLQLALGSPKPSLHNKIAEMEACDFGLIIEEKVIRPSDKSVESLRFREQASTLPYFKKIFGGTTSLGALQACVALTKLRPGGLLLWAREEPLNPIEGKESLAFLLDRAKLVCEWNLSGLQHSLPVTMPLFPKYLYLFSRNTTVQERMDHRPLRVTVQGLIRSHIELPLMLEDAFSAASGRAAMSHGQWQVHSQSSPTPQKEWADRWPDHAVRETLELLERIRTRCIPLAQIATVRKVTALHQSGNAGLATARIGDLLSFDGRNESSPAHSKAATLHIEIKIGSAQRRLAVTSPLDATQPGEKTGFALAFPNENWVAPMRAFLKSDWVSKWLDQNAEQKSGHWILTEQLVKFIPIPKSFAVMLSPGEGFQSLAPSASASESASQFIETAHQIEDLKSNYRRLLSIVGRDGQIRWKELLAILPKTECVPVSVSDQVQLSGNLPLHLPIAKIERIKDQVFRTGIMLMTESGFHLRIHSPQARVIDMIWDQLQGLVHPTWSELTQYLRIPRRIEFAESTASDILRSHGETSSQLRELETRLNNCPLF